MASILGVCLLLVSLPYTAVAASLPPSHGYCPPRGPIFPPAKQLADDSDFISASKNISASLNRTLDSGTSISVQIFDASHASPLFQFASTSEHIDTSLGVDKVDEDTVFRLGSVSKLWTILMLLTERGLDPFSDRIIQYIPELRSLTTIDNVINLMKSVDPVNFISWDEITVGELASHLAGIARDYGLNDLSGQGNTLQQAGFPALPATEIPPCGKDTLCDREQFFRGIMKSHPVVSPSRTPVYSNAGFQILGYALEAMTNKSYDQNLHSKIVKPLGLNRTYVKTPDTKLGIIPDDMGELFWNFQAGDEAPAASIYASTKDVVAVGRAILKSTLLSQATTRRWLQPASSVSDLGHGVGAPWEIVPLENFRSVDFYTKSGDIGVYSSIVALLPDYGVGFTVLAAGNTSHATVASVADLVSATLLPALDESAKKEARKRFAGTYRVKEGLNSSMSITTDDGPGLAITNWISNSTNMFESLASLGGQDPSKLSIRLYPTGLETPKQISFRAVIQEISSSGEKSGPFSGPCMTWMTTGAQFYGNVAVDDFVFGLNKDGNATSVSPRALRVSLPRT